LSRSLRAAVGAVLVCALIVLGATPAVADEFQVGILIDLSSSGSDGGAFMDGFRLAVDQSPDVSHPEGVEGGDHLGSMDVVLVVAETEGQPSEALAAALELIEGGRPPIIVADVSAEAVALLVGPVTDSETILVAMQGSVGSGLPDSPFFFVVVEGGDGSNLLTDRSPAFEEAFSTAYGRPPTAAAARGYVAGRLVDLGVEATDRDPTDNQALIAAMLDATDSAVPEPPTGSPEPAPTAGAVEEAGSSSSAATGWVVAALIALLLVAGSAVGLTRRHRGRSI